LLATRKKDGRFRNHHTIYVVVAFVFMVVVMKEKFEALDSTVEWLRQEKRIKTAFTLCCRKKVKKRDVFRMVGKFKSYSGLGQCLVVVAGDSDRCNAFHVGLSVDVDEALLKRWFQDLNSKLCLGFDKLFFTFGIHDADRYLIEHSFYEEKVFC
jgi:hypothetical protein